MRIISLAPSNTEIIYALGLGDQLIACTNFCDWPVEAKSKARIGGWIRTEPEKLAALEPDLILTSYFMPESLRNWSGPGRIVHVAPTTLEGVFESILTIGDATGARPSAMKLVHTMRAQLEAIRQSQTGAPRRVYLEEWLTPPMASGNWVPELVEIAGGHQALAKTGKPSGEFPIDELKKFDPDMMVFHWCGWGTRFDPKNILERQGWEDFRAVKEKKFFAMDDSLLNRPGPRIVEGAAQLATLIQS